MRETDKTEITPVWRSGGVYSYIKGDCGYYTASGVGEIGKSAAGFHVRVNVRFLKERGFAGAYDKPIDGKWSAPHSSFSSASRNMKKELVAFDQREAPFDLDREPRYDQRDRGNFGSYAAVNAAVKDGHFVNGNVAVHRDPNAPREKVMSIFEKLDKTTHAEGNTAKQSRDRVSARRPSIDR